MTDDELSDEVQAVAERAQVVARRAIIHFTQSEARDRPEGVGAALLTGMEVGFMISVIEAGLMFEPRSAKKTFLKLVGSVWDEAAKRFDE